ncbi:hypothetical protein GF324_02675, partial [bacterium]|nr:hypothetical protein [bacterium]
MADRAVVKPDVEFIKTLQKNGGDTLKKCYQCATCSTVCELSPAEGPFPRKEMMWASWGMKEQLVTDPDIWLCHQCNDCTTRCPRGARPGDVLAAARSYIYQTYTFPSFMGRLMSSPGGLAVLFIIPILVVAALVGFGLQESGHTLGYYLSGEA